MKVIRILALAILTYIVLWLVIDSAIGYFQPQYNETTVIRTYATPANSQSGELIAKDTVLVLLNDKGQLWVESGHWFRGWYYRVLDNPDVALVHGESLTRYTAVPVNTPEAVALMTRLMGKGQGSAYWVGRAMLMFAPIKPVRLDPVQREPVPS